MFILVSKLRGGNDLFLIEMNRMIWWPRISSIEWKLRDWLIRPKLRFNLMIDVNYVES